MSANFDNSERGIYIGHRSSGGGAQTNPVNSPVTVNFHIYIYGDKQPTIHKVGQALSRLIGRRVNSIENAAHLTDGELSRRILRDLAD